MVEKLVIKGIGVVNATPLNPDDTVNEAEYRRHVRWLIESGVGFLQPCAATGQAMQTTEEEFKRIMEITVEEAKGKVLITAYTGRPSTAETIRLTKLARDIGADAAYIIQPFFTRPNPRGIYEHYKAIAEAVPDFPLVFYNNPDRAGVQIPVDVIDRLTDEYDNFVGLKQADLNFVATSFGQLRKKITVWPKAEQELLMGLAMGAPGVLTFAGNIIPKELSDIVKLWEAGEQEKAREIFYRFLPLMEAIHWEPVPACIKYMLNRMGWNFGHCRLPVKDVTPETAARLDQLLKDLGKI
ncbi:MAG: 4-hydroxy-tetrahydrodipicolinate synthase [Clostridia bacterium]|nr:4-hydroxy-tetrahydrodipicolinate synthase [Clostridia bacterium]